MTTRERGFSNVAAVLIGLAAALLVAPLLMTWVVVDVQTAPPTTCTSSCRCRWR